MVGRALSKVAVSMAVLLSWSPVRAQSLLDGRPITPDTLHQAYTTTGVDLEELRALAAQDDLMTRAALARFLALQPQVDAFDILSSFVESNSHDIALLGLLAMSRSRSSAALDALESSLSSTDAARREYAAVALHIRAVVASADGINPPQEDVLARARSLITSEEARAWSRACDDFQLLQQAELRWLEGQAILSELMKDTNVAGCVEAVRRNPALLLPMEPIDPTGYPTRYMQAPDTAIVYGSGENGVDLLVSGRHDRLLDLVFRIDETANQLDAFVRQATRVCSGADASRPIPPVGPIAGTPSPKESLFEGVFALDLGIINHPYAFRPGRGEFVVGEDLELTFVPHLRLRYVNARRTDASPRVPTEVGLIGGYALSLRAGGHISSRFFEDRSRPVGRVGFIWDGGNGGDALDQDGYDGYRVSLTTELSAGNGEDARDLSRFPAPQLTSQVGFSYYVNDLSSGQLRTDRELRIEAEFAEHVWDDKTVRHREQRWLEPRMRARWLFGQTLPVRIGLQANSEIRLGSQASDVLATASNAHFLLSWQRRQLQIEAWAGAGISTTFVGENETKVGPTGGFVARYQGRPSQFSEFRLVFNVAFHREASDFGRAGYGGFLEHADAGIGFALSDEMRGAASVRLFIEHASFEDTDEEISWGGFSLYIPIDLVGIDQEISYLMRYSAVIDSARFGPASQEVFEALLTAGMRF